MASLVLKQIEKNTVSFAATDVTKTITLATPLTDATKTMLFWNASINSANSIDFNVLGRVVNSTTIQFERAATPNAAATVYYEVSEFLQGITVQHLNFQQALPTTQTTISTRNLAKTFAMICNKGSGSGLGTDDLFHASFRDSTTLTTSGAATQASAVVAVQVVQIDDATVQKFAGTFGTGATKAVTLTTIDPTKTFWVFGNQSVTSPFTMDNAMYLSYTDTTTLTFNRKKAASAMDASYVGYAVSLPTGVTVQNINTVIAASGTTVTPTFSSVSPAICNTLVNGLYQRYATSNVNDDNAGYNNFSPSGLTATQFTATRGGNPAVDATANVQVMQWTPSGDMCTLIWDE
jgi:hypothetical protein